jgi:hypothetical protein
MKVREISLLRRKLRISILTICLLGVWLKNIYDDKTFIESDIDLYKITSCYKDTAMMDLYRKIDSLEKVKQKTKIVYVYPVKKEYKKPIVIDSVVPVIDTTRKAIEADTLRSE